MPPAGHSRPAAIGSVRKSEVGALVLQPGAQANAAKANSESERARTERLLICGDALASGGPSLIADSRERAAAAKRQWLASGSGSRERLSRRSGRLCNPRPSTQVIGVRLE